MELETLPFRKPALEKYLASIYETEVQVIEVRKLTNDKGHHKIKEFGNGSPVLEVILDQLRQFEYI